MKILIFSFLKGPLKKKKRRFFPLFFTCFRVRSCAVWLMYVYARVYFVVIAWLWRRRKKIYGCVVWVLLIVCCCCCVGAPFFCRSFVCTIHRQSQKKRKRKNKRRARRKKYLIRKFVNMAMGSPATRIEALSLKRHGKSWGGRTVTMTMTICEFQGGENINS